MAENLHPGSERADDDVRSAVRAGGRWGVAAGVFEQVTGAAVAAALARFLSPRELGLVAAATVVVGLFALVTRVGVLPGLVRRREADRRVLSTMFWAAAGLGLAATALAVVTAPFTAAAIGAREAAALLAVLSVMILLGLLGNVAQGVALRDLRYGIVYGSDVGASALYAVIVVIGAGPLDFGPWAVVVGRLAGAVARLGVLVVGTGWRPTAEFDRQALARDARFNATVLAGQVTGFAAKNVDYWVVGRAISPTGLGIYYLAYVVPTIVRQRLTWLAHELLFPALVRVADRREVVVRAHGEVLRLLAFVAFPVLVGMALVAPRAVPLVFGEKWSAASGPMALLALAAALEVVTQVDTTVFLAAGRVSRSVTVNVARLVVLGVALPLVVADGGLVAVAAVVLAATAAGQAVAQWRLHSDFGITVADVARVLRPVLVPTAAMAVAVAVVRPGLSSVADATAVATLVVVGTAAFAATAWTGFRHETRASLQEVRAVFVR